MPVGAWNQYLENYTIQGVPQDSYILRIETREEVQVLKLVKQQGT